MSRSAPWDWAILSWLSPMCCLQVEDDQIGEVCTMLVFPAKDEKFVSLIKVRCMAYGEISQVEDILVVPYIPILTPGISP